MNAEQFSQIPTPVTDKAWIELSVDDGKALHQLSFCSRRLERCLTVAVEALKAIPTNNLYQLARWLDRYDDAREYTGEREVQADLIKMSKAINEALTTIQEELKK